jgi:hypothetical protein
MSFLLPENEVAGLLAAAEGSIPRGKQLLTWWNGPPPPMSVIPSRYPDVEMQAFFEDIPLDGRTISGMGVLQTSWFPRLALGPEFRPASLRQWVRENFIQDACRPGPDGKLSGLRYRPVMVRDAGASVARRVESDLKVRLADLGSRYDWELFRLDLVDYARALPIPDRIGRFLRHFVTEAGYVLYHPFASTSPRPIPAGAIEQACFGYTVVPWSARKTILAYGPGRFHAALKQYRAFLMNDGSVLVEVVFIVTPRSQHILDIGGIDPVYGLASIVDKLTFRNGAVLQRAHRAIDHYAMGHHGRVHVNLLEGLRDVLQGSNWQPDASSAASDA